MSLAVVAGYGELPSILLKKMNNIDFIIIDLQQDREANSFNNCHRYYKLEYINIKKIIDIFIRENIRSCLFLGKVDKNILYKNSEVLDHDTLQFVREMENWQDNTILTALLSLLKRMNIKLEKQTDFLCSLLAENIVYSKKQPSDRELNNIGFGYRVAKELTKMNIGQTVVIKNGVVLAVEALEGTDETIKRGGSLGGRSSIVVKVANSEFDERFDVPAIGINTLETMLKYNCSTLAIEAKKIFIINKEEIINFVDSNNIVFMGYKEV
jgi:DUF1009 family protein